MEKNSRTMAEPDPDYLDYLREHRDSAFVLGITYPTLKGLGHADESKQMEEDIVREQVPRDYHGQVKDYFKALDER